MREACRGRAKTGQEQAISAVCWAWNLQAPAGTLARQEIIHNRHISPDEMIEHLEAVTTDDIQEVAHKFFTTEKLALGALGNLNGFSVDRSRLEI